MHTPEGAGALLFWMCACCMFQFAAIDMQKCRCQPVRNIRIYYTIVLYICQEYTENRQIVCYFSSMSARMTSPAITSPIAEGTKAQEPGTGRFAFPLPVSAVCGVRGSSSE